MSQASQISTLDEEHHGHGRLDVGEQHNGKSINTSGPLKRSPFRALVQDFSPIWFTWTMNTGIISIILHQFPVPWHFQALNVLTTIAFVIELVLFIVFMSIFILRLIMFPKQAYSEITSDPGELSLLACQPISWLTISALVSLIVSQAYWGGKWATILAYVMWWIGAAWMLGIIFFAFIILTKQHMAGAGEPNEGGGRPAKPLPTLIVLPAVGVTTVALTGAIISEYSSGMSGGMAIPQIIFSYVVVGLGLVMAIILYAVLWSSFLRDGLPPPELSASMFLLIGPMGQSSAALQGLGTSARTNFKLYNHGTFLTNTASTPLNTAGVLLALLFTGPAAYFTFFAIYIMIERAFKRQLSWSPTWNSIIFPLGTVCTSTIFFSNEMDGDAWRALTAIILVFIVIVWFGNLIMTILGIAKGELLIVREDPRVKQEIEEQQKEK